MGLSFSILEEDSADQIRAAIQNHTSNAASLWKLLDGKQEMLLAEICMTSIGKLSSFQGFKSPLSKNTVQVIMPLIQAFAINIHLAIYMHPVLIFNQGFTTV